MRWSNSIKNIDFILAVESCLTKNAGKCCLSWHASIFKLIFHQLYMLHYSIKVLIDNFLFDANYSFSKNHGFCTLHRIGSLGWKDLAKVLLILRYLDVSTRASRKLQIWILLSRSELTVISFLDGTISYCVPQIGMLDGWTCEKVQSIFLFFVDFKLIIF